MIGNGPPNTARSVISRRYKPSPHRLARPHLTAFRPPRRKRPSSINRCRHSCLLLLDSSGRSHAENETSVEVPAGRFLHHFVVSRRLPASGGGGSVIRVSVFGPTRVPDPLGQISVGRSPTSAEGGGRSDGRGGDDGSRRGESPCLGGTGSSRRQRRSRVSLPTADRGRGVWEEAEGSFTCSLAGFFPHIALAPLATWPGPRC